MNGLSLHLPKFNTVLAHRRTETPRRKNTPPFDRWLQQTSPTYRWDWKYLEHIRGYLQGVTKGEIDRLMIFCPPQHGKSSLVTIRYPVWRMEDNPKLRIIIAAYNQTRANEFSRDARRLAVDRFPLHPERSAVEEWQTLEGGSLRAVGIGSGVTGRSGDLVILDDPVKSREEAESQTYRERVYDWYRSDLFTRLQPKSAIVLIQTRWHESDLAGRILASEDGPNWTVVNLPALAEEGDPLGRQVGEALCPARYDEAALAERRTVLGSYAFAALYQQRPAPAEGGMFRREWFEIVGAAPADAARVRYWDKAGTEGAGDYSAGVLLARDRDGVFYIEDIVRGQWSALARERIMRQTAEIDGTNVMIWIEQEPGSGGKESAQASVRNLAGFGVHTETVTGDKQTRAMPFAAQCEARNVRIVRGSWDVASFLEELCSFPYGSHDDRVDAAGGAFAKLSAARKQAGTW